MGSGSFLLSCGVFLPPLLLQAFPLLTAGWCCCSCWLASLFTVHMGGGSSSPLLWGFPPSTTLPNFPIPGCWAQAPAPARAYLARPSLCINSSGEDYSPLLFGAQGTPPSLLCVFIVLIAYYSVSLFSPPGGWSVQGSMLIWPRVVCGSTIYCLAHLVPSHLGAGDWQPWGSPGFSI
jgi:hypothetical protein